MVTGFACWRPTRSIAIPQQYNGIPGNIVPLAANPISSSTNTNPVTVFTTNPHNLSVGDVVDIQGHAVNTVVNAQWTITSQAQLTGASSFTLPVAGVGVGGATGTVQSLSLGATMQQPVDGDAGNAASVLVSLGVLADRTAFLGLGTGVYKLAQRSIIFHNDPTEAASWCHSTASLTAGTPAQWVNDSQTWSQLTGPSPIVTPGSGAAPMFAIQGAQVGDLIVATLRTTFTGTSGFRLSLYIGEFNPGVTPPAFSGGFVPMQAGSARCGASGASSVGDVTVTGAFIQGGANQTSTYIQPVILPLLTGAQTLQLIGDASLILDFYRATGMPQ